MLFARYIRPGIALLLVLTAVLGVGYPLLVTGLSTLLFPRQAAGSLLFSHDAVVGSSLIGQHFADPKYFWGRPSATSPQPYNGLASGGSNLGPLNPALLEQVAATVRQFNAAAADNTAPIPVDLVTASASGLDPDISIAGARYQAARIARVRGLRLQQVENLIAQQQRLPFLGIIGESCVNVLELNMALDRLR